MTLDPRREQEIRERLEAATKGPWSNDGYDDHPGDEGWSIVGPQPLGHVAYVLPHNRNGEADADLIAHAPEDIACLLEEVGRLRREVDEPSWRVLSDTARWPEWARAEHRQHLEVVADRDRLERRVSELEGVLGDVLALGRVGVNSDGYQERVDEVYRAVVRVLYGPAPDAQGGP